jgi:cell division septation protein DedD
MTGRAEGMEEQLTDDQSHYEISLTAGQAFVAFVLMLLSLAASFAFGLTIGRGQLDEKLAGKKDSAVEARVVPVPAPAKKDEVAVADDDFKAPEPKAAAAPAAPVITEEPKPKPVQPAAAKVETPKVVAAAPKVETPKPAAANPAYAQLLSTSDQKTAEALAAKLIDGGFTSAYVERGTTDKGMVYRVRVKFPSDSEARVAEARLKSYSKDVWITAR